MWLLASSAQQMGEGSWLHPTHTQYKLQGHCTPLHWNIKQEPSNLILFNIRVQLHNQIKSLQYSESWAISSIGSLVWDLRLWFEKVVFPHILGLSELAAIPHWASPPRERFEPDDRWINKACGSINKQVPLGEPMEEHEWTLSHPGMHTSLEW